MMPMETDKYGNSFLWLSSKDVTHKKPHPLYENAVIKQTNQLKEYL